MVFPCHLFEQLNSLDEIQHVAPLLARLLNWLFGWWITYGIHRYLCDFKIFPDAHPTLNSGAWWHPFTGGHQASDIGRREGLPYINGKGFQVPSGYAGNLPSDQQTCDELWSVIASPKMSAS